MTQSIVNCFTMIQKKVLGLFISLKLAPEICFWGKFGPETSKCFVLNEIQYKGIFKAVDFEFKNSFLFRANLISKLQST